MYLKKFQKILRDTITPGTLLYIVALFCNATSDKVYCCHQHHLELLCVEHENSVSFDVVTVLSINILKSGKVIYYKLNYTKGHGYRACLPNRTWLRESRKKICQMWKLKWIICCGVCTTCYINSICQTYLQWLNIFLILFLITIIIDIFRSVKASLLHQFNIFYTFSTTNTFPYFPVPRP